MTTRTIQGSLLAAIICFSLGVIGCLAPVITSTMIRPAFNTPYPPQWAIFIQYGVVPIGSGILWLVFCPVMLVMGIRHVVRAIRSAWNRN